MATADQDQDDYKDTPGDWQRRWTLEFAAAKDEAAKFKRAGEDVCRAFLVEETDNVGTQSRRPYFTAGVQTIRSVLFGNTPKVIVSRKFSDAQDDVARVAAEIMERVLNEDIEAASKGHDAALAHALDDFLLPGLGTTRHRYTVDWEEPEEGEEETPAITKPDPETGEPKELAPAVPAEPKKQNEDVETIYEHWQDQLWGPSRVFEEVPWWAFRAQMTKGQLTKRFGKEMASGIPMNAKKNGANDDSSTESTRASPWARADVWEIWDKRTKKVFWFVEGHTVVLDMKDDPLSLQGFWPFQRPLMANLTTQKLMPKADYILTQDIYKEIDEVSARITLLQKAIAVRGVYDKDSDELSRLLTEAKINELIPVENWAKFKERGGIAGSTEWLPLEMIGAALDKLRDVRAELKAELYELTGMSDILRGQAGEEATATEQSIKAKFASTRLQYLQNEFARFASDGQRIRAEIMCKMFEPETFIQRSNIMRTPDAQKAMEAVAFLKSDDFYSFRIEIKPESVALTDYAQLKSERSEVLGAIAGYMQQAMPLAQMMPGSTPMLLEFMSWFLSGLKGTTEIQGVLDRAISAAEQMAQQQANAPPQQQQPDPKMLAAQTKAQGDLAKIQAQTQSEMARMQAETQQLAIRQRNEAVMNVQEQAAKERLKQGSMAAAINPVGDAGVGP